MPPPSLATRPHRPRNHEDHSSNAAHRCGHKLGTPSSSLLAARVRALPPPTQASSTPDVVVQSPPVLTRPAQTPRSHRSLPPLTIGAQVTPSAGGPADKGRLAARPSTASTTASRTRPSTASTSISRPPFDGQSTRSGGRAPVSAASSPTQHRSGSRFSFRQVRSGSCSSSVGRLSSVPSLTGLSTIFNGGALSTSTTVAALPTTVSNLSPSTPTRRRSSSVGSLLRAVVPSPPASANPAFPASLTEWEVEPNVALDDPFARPPPTAPSTPTSLTATPTRAEAQTAGSLAPSRLVRALEAIEEPESGSPANPSSSVEEEEGDRRSHGEVAMSASSEGDNLQRVLTPMPFTRSQEEQWPHSDATHRSKSESCEHRSRVDQPVYHTPPPARPTSSSTSGLELITPTAQHRARLPPDSPSRRRTDRRASSPRRSVDPLDFPSPRKAGGGGTGSSPMSPSPSGSSAFARNRASSLRLLATSLASSGSARLVALRRIRSSLRRRSRSPSPLGTDARPSESSELSFSCRGAEASMPDLQTEVAGGLRYEEAHSTKSVPPLPLFGLARPPPTEARLSGGSHQAWWTHPSSSCQTSSSSESLDPSNGRSAGHRSSSLLSGQPISAPFALSIDAGGTGSGGASAVANARWSGYQLPPLADVSPLNSSLFLPAGVRRSSSSTRKSLRRMKSSPAMIGHVPSMPNATVISFAVSSKFSSASFVTAQSNSGRLEPSSSPESTLGIDLNELDHLVDTFVPAPDAASSAPSSAAALTPRSALFGSPLTSSANDDNHDLISPITPATPSEFGWPIAARRDSSERLAL